MKENKDISKNEEKLKKTKIIKYLIILITIIILLISTGYIYKVIVSNIETTVKYGYTDTKMYTLIEPKFDYAEDFYNKVAKIGVKKQGGGSDQDRVFYYYLYGFINIKGDIIVEPIYNELSNFNEFGYAYGFIRPGLGKYGVGQFHKINQAGNIEEITSKEYYENKNIKYGEKDKIIMIKKNIDRKIDIEYIVLESIFPAIIALLSIIIIIKTIKKEDK